MIKRQTINKALSIFFPPRVCPEYNYTGDLLNCPNCYDQDGQKTKTKEEHKWEKLNCPPPASS